MRLRFGRGYVGIGEYKSKEAGRFTKEYAIWSEMFKRCYCEIYKKNFTTYNDCAVREDWFNFQNFATWSNKQRGFGLANFDLDKDLLLPGNKLYSQDTCCFLPKAINYCLVKSRTKATLNNLPIGVGKLQNGTYQAAILIENKKLTLGTFSDPVQAWELYKEAKQNRLKDLANMYATEIEPAAYQALINYEVKMYG